MIIVATMSEEFHRAIERMDAEMGVGTRVEAFGRLPDGAFGWQRATVREVTKRGRMALTDSGDRVYAEYGDDAIRPLR